MTGYGTVASHMGLPDAGLATYSDMVGRVKAFAVPGDGPAHRRRRHRLRRAPQRPPHGPRLRGGGRQRHPARGPGIPEEVRPHAGAARDPDGGHGEEDPRGRRVARLARLPHHREDGRAHHARPRRGAAARGGLREGRRRHPVHRVARVGGGDARHRPRLRPAAGGQHGGEGPHAGAHEGGARVASATGSRSSPSSALLAAIQAMAGVYAHLKATGSTTGCPTPLYDFGDLSLLMGFQDVWDFDKNHAD